MILGAYGVLLGEGLDCEVAAVCEPLHLIDSGKPTLAQLLDWLVEAMEAELVEAAS